MNYTVNIKNFGSIKLEESSLRDYIHNNESVSKDILSIIDDNGNNVMHKFFNLFRCNSKYALVPHLNKQFGKNTIYRIMALRDFGDVKQGDIGGYVSSFDNLSEFDNCWIYNDAIVTDDARVQNNAKVYGGTIMENATIFDNARIIGNVVVSGTSSVSKNAWIHADEEICIFGSSSITDNARIYGYVYINGKVKISENAVIDDFVNITQNCEIRGHASVYGKAVLQGDVIVNGYAKIYGNACVKGECMITGYSRVTGNSFIKGNVCIYSNTSILGNTKIIPVIGKEIIINNATIKNGIIRNNDDYMVICNIGSRHDKTTFYKTNDGIYVTTGCFCNSLDEFVKAVKEKHHDTKYCTEYLLAVLLANQHFNNDTFKIFLDEILEENNND